MRLGSTSITVTGIDWPSSTKIRVMPHLRPTIPIFIDLSPCTGLLPAMAAHSRALHTPGVGQARLFSWASTQADLNLYTRRQVQLHQCVNRLLGRLNDVQQALVGANFVLITRVFVHMRRDQNSKLFLTGRQRNRATNLGTGAFRRLHNFHRRTVDQLVIERLETNSYALTLHLPETPTDCLTEKTDQQP